jgi:class 3 adenylate cyclase
MTSVLDSFLPKKIAEPAEPGGTIGADKLLDLMADDQDNWQAQEYVSASGNENERNTLRTVLFTDLVGHTEMMSRLGDEAGRAVLREHERITRDVLKAHGGTEVKTMGDGFMASFGSVTRAVECAITLQRAFAEREGEPLSVRVGLNAGEPIEEDGDLFGATVILASRIAAKAGGGEILVSDNVRSLCAGKGILFADRGEFVAKGFEEPVRVYEVSWRRKPPSVAGRASREAFSVTPISGEGFVLLDESETYAQLGIANVSGRLLRKVSVRLLAIDYVLHGSLLPEQNIQPRLLRWSSREPAYGENHQWLDIPSDTENRFLDVAVLDRSAISHWTVVTADPNDRISKPRGWYRVTVAISAEGENAPAAQRIQLRLALGKREGIPPPLQLNKWESGDEDRVGSE